MKKIPTVFKRDPDDMKRVLPEVNPECQWVLDGKGVATRKYDGTCVGYFPVVKGEPRISGGVGSGGIDEAADLTGAWLARREVKPGKTPPPNYIPVETDPNTHKTMGWEPIEQSSFVAAFNEAVDIIGEDPYFGTYELCGPKINGNPEGYIGHILVRHSDAELVRPFGLMFESLRETMLLVLKPEGAEGLVWHHPDGRMAKLKVRDFA